MLRINKFASRVPLVLIALVVSVPGQGTTCLGVGCTGSASLPGEGSVDGGSATYRLPIELPSVGDDFRPGLSLYYGSRGSDGPLGVGWRLSTDTSAVFRCPATFSHDGYSASVAYEPSDHLCLDGERLVAVQGAHGRDGTQYVREVHAGVVVTQHGDTNSISASFELRSPGDFSEILSEAEIPPGAPAPLTWHTRSQRYGNRGLVSYEYGPSGTGDFPLVEIRYAGVGSPQGSEAYKFVHFDYARRDNALGSSLGQGRTIDATLLTRISVGSAANDGTRTLIREYRLTYHASPSTGRPLLERVDSCMQAIGASRCAIPTTVRWNESPLHFDPPLPLVGAPAPTLSSPWQVSMPEPKLPIWEIGGDYDADGRRDVVGIDAQNRVTIALLRPHAKFQAVAAQALDSVLPPTSRSGSVDLSHLGTEALLGRRGDHLALARWKAGGFTEIRDSTIPASADIVVMDVDGDGQQDVLTGNTVDGIYTVTWYRNADSNDQELHFDPGEPIVQMPGQAKLHLAPALGLVGNGRALWLRSSDGIEGAIMFRSRPDRKLVHDVVSSASLGLHLSPKDRLAPVFADIDGDGLSDHVFRGPNGQIEVQVNRDGFFSPPQDTGIIDMRRTPVAVVGSLVADIDTDGRDELVFPARRLVDFCVQGDRHEHVCGDALQDRAPAMDMGIYEFDAIQFVLQPNGRFRPILRSDIGLVAQANRASAEDAYGDGHTDILSAFDAGVSNGRFKRSDGTLSNCPQVCGCGLRIASRTPSNHGQAKGVIPDTVASVKREEQFETEWRYYTLADSARALYSVPGLDDDQRFIDTTRYFFTSSMPVVGEFLQQAGSPAKSEVRFEYGAATYNTQGRGFEGFRWIRVHEVGSKVNVVNWFRQFFPYAGVLQRRWVEPERSRSPIDGIPPPNATTITDLELSCVGPQGSPIAIQQQCAQHAAPTFQLLSRPKAAIGSATGANPDSDVTSWVEEAEFRSRWPRPPQMEALKTVWTRTEEAFRALASRGARASVVVIGGDGKVHHGEDWYFFGNPNRMREVRDNYEAITEGDKVCSITPPQSEWKCAKRSVYYGLQPLDWEALTGGELEQVACPDSPGHCLRIALAFTGAKATAEGGNTSKRFSLHPERTGHLYYLLVSLPEYTPVSLHNVDSYGSVHAEATFTYDFTRRGVPIVLPKRGSEL